MPSHPVSPPVLIPPRRASGQRRPGAGISVGTASDCESSWCFQGNTGLLRGGRWGKEKGERFVSLQPELRAGGCRLLRVLPLLVQQLAQRILMFTTVSHMLSAAV